MIIDVHTHIGFSMVNDPPAAYALAMSSNRRLRATGARPWKADLRDYSFFTPGNDNSDPTGDKSYEAITGAGIDKCLLLPLDFNLMGLNRYRNKAEYSPKRSLAELNKHIADVAAKHPDKYIAFFGLDPRHGGEGLRLLKEAVLQWGMKGVKLHPTAGFFPHDREICYPLYELCLELDLPVLAHCGPESAGTLSRYADPIYWEDVASDFPELRVCLAHAGGALSHVPGQQYLDSVLAILGMYDNFYTDVSTGQVVYARAPVNFYRTLRRIMDWTPGKVLWGTDNPFLRSVGGLDWKGYIDVFRNPKEELLERAGVSFSREEIDGILGENAKHWLKIETA